MLLFSSFFKEAIEQKWMIAAQVPVLSSKGGTGTRRAAFSEEEYDVILNEIYEGEQNAHSEKTRQIRELLYDYCEIAVNTGIRPRHGDGTPNLERYRD